MGADEGDMIYLSDERKWLGGLKSVHAFYGKPHTEDGIVYLSKNHLDSGRFDEQRKLIGEKEL